MFQQRIFSNSNPIEPKGVDLTLPVSPTRKLDVANVTLRKYPLYTGNAETLAWEKYLSNQVPGKELNFIRDFYVNDKVLEEQDIRRFSEQIKDSNQQQQNSYDLAKFISKQIITDELIKQEKDQRNKKLVQARISQTLGKLKQQKNEEILKWKYGLKRLFHQMREAVEHILNAEGEKKFHRLHELIKQKAHITEVFLQGLPKRSAAEIQEITSNVRLLLSKKTDELNVLKQEFGDDYFDYDDKTIREMSRASSDTGSVMSERLTEIRQQNDKQKKKESEKKLEPFYDFKVLKEKWKTNDEEKVKGVIRRVIVKDCLMEAEHLKARAYRMNDKKHPVRPISQPKKSKIKKQVMVKSTDESAKKLQERKEKKIAQSQTQSFMSQTRQKYKREQQRQEFFSNYNLRNTIGEQFNAAVGYANLF